MEWPWLASGKSGKTENGRLGETQNESLLVISALLRGATLDPASAYQRLVDREGANSH